MTDKQNTPADEYMDPIHSQVVYDVLDKLDYTAILIASNGDIIFANKPFLDLYGLTQEQADGRKIYDPALGITTKDRCLHALDKTRANGGRLKYERDMIRNGKVRYSETTIIMYEAAGNERILYFSKDITETRVSQMEAREMNRMLNKIIDNLPVYLFVKDVDDDLRYLIWNKAFADYSKIPAERVIGRTDFEVFPKYQDAQQFRDDDLRVIETGEMAQKNESYIAADGTMRIVQTYKTLVHRQDRGPLLVGISLDITDIDGIEKELVVARLRAEESDRLKSLFLANMSHEIRTPLNAIVGFAGMLSEAEDQETYQQFLDIINENTELLLTLINDILDLSKIEAGTLEYTRAPMDLFDTFTNVHTVYKHKVKKNVTLCFDNEAAPRQLIINEDRNRIMQVIDNLVNNAVKFTNSGEIHYGYKVERGRIVAYVSDTGRGIPKDKQQQIFDRFVKLDNFVQGTGLGLAICKLIVETLGGEISVESEEGRGTTFRFTIPYAVSDTASDTISDTTSDAFSETISDTASSSEFKTILVAEDVNSNFMVVRTMVKGRHELIWATDGEEAVQMAREKHPDLILMDIKMPRMDGLEATRQIRTFNTHVPIVALTANAYEDDRQMVLQAGMNNFLPKPINRDAFEAILTAYL